MGAKVHTFKTKDTKENLSSLPEETQLALSKLVAEHYLAEMRTLFKMVINPMGLLPLFTAHFDNSELTAAFILGLLLEKEGIANLEELEELANDDNNVPAERLIDEVFNEFKNFHDTLHRSLIFFLLIQKRLNPGFHFRTLIFSAYSLPYLTITVIPKELEGDDCAMRTIYPA